MSDQIKEIMSRSMVTVRSHGAFGEPERYDQLDLEKFAQLIIEECILAAEEAQADFYVIHNIKLRLGLISYD